MNKQLTSRITILLFGAVIVTAVTIGTVLYWMSTEHNRQSAEDSQVMIQGGLAGIDTSLRKVTVDYSWWGDAVDNVTAENLEWIYSNMGSGVTESSTMDLLVIVQPDGSIKYGWKKGGDETPDPTILDRAVVDRMVASLVDLPVSDVQAKTQFALVGNNLYLLAAARVSPDKLENADPKQLPINIMGFLFDVERVANLGKSFLIDDLKLSNEIAPGQMSIPLKRGNGEAITNLVWIPPAPGIQMLQRSVLPVSLTLGIFAILAMYAAVGARRSAMELSIKEADSYLAARTDSLSNLPNRFHFTERLSERAMKEACRNGQLAVIFLDIDGFKNVNDTIGHAGGDELICELARRISKILPKEAFLARVGGDEFNILMVSNKPEKAAESAALGIINAVRRDIEVMDKVFSITTSVGFAISAVDLTTEEVVRRADVAMYEAKNTKAGLPIIYRAEYESNMLENKKIEEALRVALDNNEINVHYQPIVRSTGGELQLVEALVRWTSKEFGPMSPAVFIPIAEASGLISKLGAYVFRQACEDMVTMPGLKVSINVSPVQLRDPMLVKRFLGIAEHTGASPKRIEIELTEGIVVSHPEIAREKLMQLKQAGFSISLDDFGTGFSSIGYLRQLPFDKLKIDRSFVMDLETDPESAALMLSIASLGRALNLSVVAEGVETDEQAKLVHLAGCDLMQGYLFSKPLPFDELRVWRKNKKPDVCQIA